MNSYDSGRVAGYADAYGGHSPHAPDHDAETERCHWLHETPHDAEFGRGYWDGYHQCCTAIDNCQAGVAGLIPSQGKGTGNEQAGEGPARCALGDAGGRAA